MSENALKYLTELVCFCSIPLKLMTQVCGCLRSHHFSEVRCVYTCMENQGTDCESSPFCCKVCNSGSERKQVKLLLSFSLELCFPLYIDIGIGCNSQYKFQRALRLNMNASWQETCKGFLSVGVL